MGRRLRGVRIACCYALVTSLLSTAVRAEAPDMLLERAAFVEETQGNLSAATELYRRVMEEDRRDGRYAARAKFQLAVCLWKLGRTAEAQHLFHDFMKENPAQEALVAQAARFVSEGHRLAAPCWKDGETLEFTIEFQTKVEAGFLAVSAHRMQFEGQDAWRFQSQQNAPDYGGQSKHFVYVSAEDYRPLLDEFSHPIVGGYSADYDPGVAHVTATSGGVTTRKDLHYFGTIYDHEQHWHLLRQLPLAVGYRTSLPVLSCADGDIYDLEVRVTGIEEITCPAGTFSCFRVETRTETRGNQALLWYSTDENRYLVRFDGWIAKGMLRAVHQRGADEPTTYENEDLGFSLSAPAGWFFYDRQPADKPGQTEVFLLHPDAAFDAMLTVQESVTDSQSVPETAEQFAQRTLQNDQMRWKGLQLRPDSWNLVASKTNVGRSVARYVADYREGEQSRLQYVVCMVDHRLTLRFVAQGSSEQLSDIQAAVDELIESYRAQ